MSTALPLASARHEQCLKVGVVANDLSHPSMRGLARYTAGLVRALAESGEADVVLFSREPLAGLHGALPGERRVWRGACEMVWEQWDLPRRAAVMGVDVLHAPGNRGLCAFAPCPTVLTRHDEIERLFPPDFPGSLRSRLRLRYSDAISLRRATSIATVSEVSRRDVLRLWGLGADRVHALGEGIDPRFFAPVAFPEVQRVRERHALSPPYVLYLGGFDRRKDVVTLVRAYAAWGRRDVGCVLAGSQRGEGAAVQAAIEAHGLSARVRVLGEVADADVSPLCAGAACFVYPSRYEGFGLQAAECMALGVPLIVSDGGALPEVVGDAALVFPAGNVPALVASLDRLFGDQTLRARLIERGRTRAEQFRWETVVAGYLGLYRELVARRRRP